jgi:hypothetical protein
MWFQSAARFLQTASPANVKHDDCESSIDKKARLREEA